MLLPQATILPQVPQFVFPNLEFSKIKSNNDLRSISTQAIFDTTGVRVPPASRSSNLDIQHHFRIISFVDHQGPPSVNFLDLSTKSSCMRPYTQYFLHVKKLRSHVHIERDRDALFAFLAQLWSVKQKGPQILSLPRKSR